MKMNPDEAVAAGAAILATMNSGNETQKGGISEIIMVDVTPISLGIEMVDGTVSMLIPKNTSVPTSMTKQYTNSDDNQASLAVKIMQGDKVTGGKILSKDCVKVAEFELGGMAGHKKGQALVEVTFEVDTDGCLNVTAVDKKSNNANMQKLTVQDACRFDE